MTDATAATPPAKTPGKSFPRWLGIALLALWAMVSWFILTDFPRNLAVPDIVDMSWRGVLTYAAEQNWQWGRKIVFTYGPLGYVHHPVFTSESWWKSLTYQALRSAVYLLLLWRVGAGLRKPELRWILYLTGVVLPALEVDGVHMLLVWFTGILLARGALPHSPTLPRKRVNWDQVATWSGLLLTIVGAHIKITFLLHGVAMLVLVGGELLLARQWRAAILPGVVFILGFFILWVTICGQALGNLPDYLIYGLDMASGYSEAMGLPAPPRLLILGILMGAGVVALYALPLLRENAWRRHGGMALLTIATLYLAWKQAIVRADIFHSQTLIGVAMPMIIIGLANLPAQRLGGRRLALGSGAAIVIFSVLWQFPINMLWDETEGKLAWFKLMTKPANIGPAFASGVAKFQLPQVKAEVGNATIDMISLRESIVILNGLNYHPAPVFQSYAAFTPKLIALNTKFYQSADAPEYVLYMITRLDERLPSADNALVILEILKNYTPVLKTGVFVLYKRTPRDPVTKTLIASGELVSGQILSLPETQDALWCELDIKETLLGKLYKQALYRPTLPLDIIIKKQSARNRFGIVPPMASKGFLLSPLMYSDDTMISTYDPDLTPPPLVMGIYLDSGQRRLMQSRVPYRIYKLNLALDPAKEPETLAKVRELRQAWIEERLKNLEKSPADSGTGQ